jgi:hypothetical protein
MKNLFLLLIATLVLMACEDRIFPELPSADAPIVIDAWLYRKPETQTIRISRANTYFDQGKPVGISGAIVQVVDESDPGNPIIFTESAAGIYEWIPSSPTDTFGVMGNSYRLSIQINSETYTSFSAINRVPKVDSITWRLEPATPFSDAAYFGEFWSRDFIGDGDAYWIKSWKNGEQLTKPSELIIAYDAGFSAGGNADGLIFIQPIRDGMNPLDLDEDDRLIPPYELGDSAYVEISSITKEAFFFLQQVQIQTDRPGGFGELFATPLANIQSNITSSNPKEKVVGFFSTSAVRGKGRRFTEEAIFEDK